MARSRLLAALAGLLTTAVVVAGCGAGGGDGSRITASAVARETRKAGTVRIWTKISFTTDGKPGSPGSTMTSEGVYDFTNRRGAVTTHSGIGADAFQGEARWIGSRQYVRFAGGGMEAFRAAAGTGAPLKPWVALPSDVLDMSDDGSLGSGLAGSFLGLGPQPDPERMLDELRRAASRVDVVGRERVRGTDTTHERFTLDGTKLAPSTTAKPAAGVALEVRGDVWIDADGRLRRLRVAPFEEVSIELELWDYGAPVHVEAPPADQVTDLTTEAGVTGWMEQKGIAPVGAGALKDLGMSGPKLTGPWKELASGTWRDVTWRFWQAPAGDEVCSSFEASPAPGPEERVPAEVAGVLPMHDGHVADCESPALVEEPLLLDPRVGDGTLRYRVVAGQVAEGATGVTLTLRNGGRIEVPVEPATHVFVWFGGPVDGTVPTHLDVVGRDPMSCTLDIEGLNPLIDDCSARTIG